MSRKIQNNLRTDNRKIQKTIQTLEKLLSKEDLKSVASSYGCDDIRERDLPLYPFTLMMILSGCLGRNNSLPELSLSCLEWRLTEKSISPQRISQQVDERGYEYFETLYEKLIEMALILPRRCRRKVLKRFQKVNILDSTCIHLCNKLMALYQGKQGRAGLKINTRFNLDYLIPEAVMISSIRDHDNRFAPYDKENKGILYVFDRGYESFQSFEKIIAGGNDFVTRIRKIFCCRLVKDLKSGKIFQKKPGFEKMDLLPNEELDYLVELRNGLQVRFVKYYDEDAGEYYTYLSSLTDTKVFTKKDIRTIYKYRWQVEIFFRDLKHVLGMIKIVYETKERIQSQIYASLCYYLIIRVFILISSEICERNPIDFSFKKCQRAVREGFLQMTKEKRTMEKEIINLIINKIIRCGVKAF